MNLITVFADASFWEGDAGYAVWCRGDGEARHQFSAAITWGVEHIDEAETVALSMAITDGLKYLPFQHGGSVVAQSDSLRTLNLFAHYGAKISHRLSDRTIFPQEYGSPLQHIFVKDAMLHASEAGATVWLKHIKAHTGKHEPRSQVNEWCDREAKKRRWEAYRRRIRMEEAVEAIA